MACRLLSRLAKTESNDNFHNNLRIWHCVNLFEQEAHPPLTFEGKCTPKIVQYKLNLN